MAEVPHRPKKKPVMWWTDDEVKRILSMAKGKSYIAIGLGYFCALRIDEVRRLRVADLDFRSMQVWTVGKGGYRAAVPMLKDGSMFWIDLKRWVEGEELDAPVIKGRKKDGTVSVEYMRRGLKKIIRGLNLTWGDKGHFHLLRHSRLTFLKSKTGNMTFVKEFARHSAKTNTEAIYTHAPVENLGRRINRSL